MGKLLEGFRASKPRQRLNSVLLRAVDTLRATANSSAWPAMVDNYDPQMDVEKLVATVVASLLLKFGRARVGHACIDSFREPADQ